MRDLFKDVIQYYNWYFANSMYFILLLAAFVYLFAAENKRSRYREILLYYPILMFCVIWNPLLAYFTTEYMIGSVYWRLYWMIPIVMIIAYAAAVAVCNQKKFIRQLIILTFACMIIMFSGKNIVTRVNYSYMDNLHKLPNAVIPITDMLYEHGGDKVKAIVDGDLMCYVRQYNARIKLFYGRNVLRIQNVHSERHIVFAELNKEQPDYGLIISLARKNKCNYLVVKNSPDVERSIVAQNFKLVGTHSIYAIYCDDK